MAYGLRVALISPPDIWNADFYI